MKNSYRYYYETPEAFTNMWMSSDGDSLTGLWFEDSRDCVKHEKNGNSRGDEILLPVFEETIRWLDLYFSGKQPDFLPAYRLEHVTEFRQMVIDHMLTIPYGKTVTYGDIAREIAQKRGLKRMSAQAVGGAVGWNPLCIIIPCHRVVGTDGFLTGYGGGIENKISLLRLEGNDMNQFRRPL